MTMAASTPDDGNGCPDRRSKQSSKLLKQAEKAIGEYSTRMGQTYTEAEPLLYRALAATYALCLNALKHADLMKMFLEDRKSGPVSKNPLQPIMRKLWKDVQTRESINRCASCLAFAQSEKVGPADFAGWLKATTIKAAAAKWSKLQRRPDAAKQAEIEQKTKVTVALSRSDPIRLPDEIASGLHPGCQMAVIRVTADRQADLFVFDVAPSKVDAFIIRETRR